MQIDCSTGKEKERAVRSELLLIHRKARYPALTHWLPLVCAKIFKSTIAPPMTQPKISSTADPEIEKDKALCLHCQLPLNSGPQESPSGTNQFCCQGCAFVYELLNSSELGDFYEMRKDDTGEFAERYGRKPHPSKEETYSFLDEESTHQHYSRPLSLDLKTADSLNQIREAVFLLEGIHCTACMWLLEQLPKLLPGVHQIRIDLVRSLARFSYSPERVTLSQVASLIARLGYPPTPLKNGANPVKRSGRHNSLLIRIGVAAFSAGNTMLIAVSLYQGLLTGIEEHFRLFFSWMSFALTLPAITYSALPFYRAALSGIRLKTLHIDLPISVAIILGFTLSTVNLFRGSSEIYFDSLSMLIFLLLIGRWIQQLALDRAHAALLGRPNILPDFFKRPSANHPHSFESYELRPREELEAGVMFSISEGDIAPADGVVSSGEGAVDESFLTGESLPKTIRFGDEILAGSILSTGAVIAKTSRIGSETHLGKIVDSIQQCQAEKSPLVDITSRWSRLFVAGVLLLSVITFCFWLPHGIEIALNSTLALLIVTCPCALGLSAPLTEGVALARAMRKKIFIKGSKTLEALTTIRTLLFDKTGTLTAGQPKVIEIECFNDTVNMPLIHSIISSLEHGESHPYAKAIRQWLPEHQSENLLISKTSILGQGVEGRDTSGDLWRLGSRRFSLQTGIGEAHQEQLFPPRRVSSVFLSKNSEIILALHLQDPLKDGAEEMMKRMKSRYGIKLLSGDEAQIAISVGTALGLSPTEIFAPLLPHEKRTIALEQTKLAPTAMIGDGINDAEALQSATVGIAVRGGAERCLEIVDVYLMNGKAEDIEELFVGANRTLTIIRQNLVISVIYNFTGGTLAMMGYIDPLIAALLMPLSSLTVIGCSIFRRSF